MRVLILGHGGFLGRHVRAELERAPDLTVIAGPRSAELDLGRAGPDTWARLLNLARPDAVVNCAGCVGGPEEDLTAANVTLVEELIAAAAARPRPPHLVHLGSAAEYGPGARVVSEDTPARPASAYGHSKLRGTRALLAAAGELPVTVLRVANPVGAGQGEGTLPGRAARQFRDALREHRPEVEFGDLSAGRDFIAACDVARAVSAVLRRPPALDLTGPLLNVGRGEGVTARALVGGLAQISGYAGRITERADGSARSAGVSWQQSDISRLRRLGWAPASPLRAALLALWREVASLPAEPAPALRASA